MHTQIPDIHNLMNMFSKVVEQHGLIMALKCDKAPVYTFSTNLTSHFNLKQDLQRNHLHILDILTGALSLIGYCCAQFVGRAGYMYVVKGSTSLV